MDNLNNELYTETEAVIAAEEAAAAPETEETAPVEATVVPEEEGEPVEAEEPARKKKLGVRIGAAVLAVVLVLALVLPGGLLSTPLTRDGMVMRIGDYKLMADEYIFQILPYKDQYTAYDPDYFVNNPEAGPLFIEQSETYLINQYVIHNWAQELGLSLSTEELNNIDAVIASEKAAYESEEAFHEALAAEYLNEDLMRRILIINVTSEKIANYLYAKGSEYLNVSDEELTAFVQEQGAFAYRQILINYGEDEATDIEKHDLAVSIAEACAEDPAAFDKQMALYNEDVGAEYYPNGYNYLPGELTEEMQNVVLALEIGAISDMIPTDQGYLIIQRVEPDTQLFYYDIVQQKIEAEVTRRIEATDVKYGLGYGRITIDDIKQDYTAR